MTRRAAVAAAAVILSASITGCGDSGETARRPSGKAASTTASTTAAPPSTTVVAPVTTAPPSDDPRALAAKLARTERAIRSPATPAARLPGLALEQQRAYRVLGARPDWLAAVVSGVPAALRAPVLANASAEAELHALGRPRDRLPSWRIVAPAPPDELLGHYRKAEATFGVPWPYLAAIHLVETRMGRVRGTSIAGAQGPMQFLPSTWAHYGEGDIDDDGDAIRAAARYLRANGAPADMARALWHYNHSDRYVRAVTAYARQMQADERAFRGYYHWQVLYRTTSGDVLLPVGYGAG